MFRKFGDYYLSGRGLLLESVVSEEKKNSFNAYNYIGILKNMISAYLSIRSTISNNNDNEDKISKVLNAKIEAIENYIKTIIIDFLYIFEGSEDDAYDKLNEIRGVVFLNKQAIRDNKDDKIKFENIRLPIYPDALSRSWANNICEIKNIPAEFNMDNVVVDDEEIMKLLNRASKNKIIEFFETLLNSETLNDIYTINDERDDIEGMLGRFERNSMESRIHDPYEGYKDCTSEISRIFSSFKFVKLMFTDVSYEMDLNEKSLTSSETVNSLKAIIELLGAQLFYTTVQLLFYISNMSNIVSKNDSIKIAVEKIKRKYVK